MKRHKTAARKIALEMTPMVDIVFLMLVFFVMTFKIVVPEGDFSINMPPAGQSDTQPLDLPPEPLRVKLVAAESGELSAIQLGDNSLGKDFGELRQRVLGVVMQRGGPEEADIEVELAPDEHLHYRYVIDAITAVTGEIRGGTIHKICDKIKFSPRRKE